MLYTITNTGLENGRPVQIGANTISVLNRELYVFSLADFTTDTSPVYSDPEGDALSYVKLLTLPLTGTLYVNGIQAVLNQLVISAEITANTFKYQAFGADPAYADSFAFDIADVGSQSLSGLNTGLMTLDVAAVINSAPSCVGDNTVNKNYGESHVFTIANFTTETIPPYTDPDGDAAWAVKILTLPVNGDLLFNGVAASLNQEILMTEVAAGFLTYVPDPFITVAQTPSFTFSVSDAGSKIFTSNCI